MGQTPEQILGERSARLKFPGGKNLPIIGVNPFNLNFRYGPENAMDRVIGFSVLLGNGNDSPEIIMKETNTGWLFDHVFAAGQGGTALGNVETMPDAINLSITFSAATARNVYMSFFNFEVIPNLF